MEGDGNNLEKSREDFLSTVVREGNFEVWEGEKESRVVFR